MFLRAGIAGYRAARSLGLLGAALVATLLVSPASPVAAQDVNWWSGDPPSYPRRAIGKSRRPLANRASDSDDAEPPKKGKVVAVSESKPSGPLFAILSVSDQHISVYNNDGLVARSKVSTGMPGHRTPMGIFTIIGRERYHASNIYSAAPMPFMQRITWSGVALHLGVVPGYPASHGCIRLPSAFAQRLWGLTKVSERVVISPHEVTPSGFAHSRLPVPRMQRLPATLTDNTTAKVAEVTTGSDAPVSASPKSLNPLEYAQALRARAAAEVAVATKTLEEYAPRKEVMSDAIRKALSELRAAEAARSQAEARLAARTEALATQRDAHDIQRAAAAKAAAEAQLAESSKKLEAAVDNPTFKTPEGNEAFDAERKLMEMRSSLTKAQAAAKRAERLLSPISVLVSKKDGKVYVRQALAPVLEAPVTIRNPEALLGTHVYIATAHQNGSSLGWTVVSMPISFRGQQESGSRRPREPQAKSGSDPALAANAAEALERIELPTEVSSLISERLWIGASLIISDQPLSDETSDVGTDLVITMR
jgi:hypothetical protein